MGKPTLGAGILRKVEMANELLSDEKIQEAADKYAPVWEIDGKQLSKVEILQRQHARLRSIAMAQVDHLKAMGYVKWDREKVARQIRVRVINADEGEGVDNITPWGMCEQKTRDYWLGEADQLKEILTGGKDEKV